MTVLGFNRVKAAVLTMLVMVALIGGKSAEAQPVRDSVISRAQDYLTSYVAYTSQEIRYGAPIYVGDAQHVYFPYTLSGCGASTPVSVAIQFLEEDPYSAGADWGSGDAGFELTTGWSYTDTATTNTHVASGNYITSAPVRAPYCRLALDVSVSDDGDGRIVSYYYLRYTPQVDEVVGELLAEDLRVTDDAIVEDDLTVTDDAAVGGDLTVTGATSSADLRATDDLFVGDDAVFVDDVDINDDLSVDDILTTTITVGGGTSIDYLGFANATITAGATTCTLTLPSTPVSADGIIWGISPAVAANGYAGHGDDYFTWEGGTTAECRISSATFVNLRVTAIVIKD